MNIAIIPAGGQGRRMAQQSSTPKQFLTLGGVPIIVHTLKQFEACPDIDRVIVALPEAEVASGIFHKLIEEYGLKKVLPPVVGAAERQGSVFCGLKAISESVELDSEAEIVAIHDGVRPFITPEMISASIAAAKRADAAICAISATDTIKEVEEGSIVRTVPRVRAFQAQTPQTFKYRMILDAHQRAMEEGFSATDDAMLVERLGVKVAIVEGSAKNIKITKPTDLIVAEMILKNEI